MNDFDNWYRWAVRHFGIFDREIGIKLYNEFYNCKCATCEYRKERGLMPYKASETCTLPTSLKPLEHVLDTLLHPVVAPDARSDQ